MKFQTIAACVGNTPLVKLQRMDCGSNTVLLKLEGNNPAGSVKDRPALSMVAGAEKRGEISPGDRLIEATSGNTGIALAMIAAVKGYKMTLVMPDNSTAERLSAMQAYGAEIILSPAQKSMEGAIDIARDMQQKGLGHILDQFANPDNPRAHYHGTAPEIWRATQGKITHFVSAMGTTGTIMGVSRYLKQQNPAVQIIGVQPEGDAKIPGIRCWPVEYLPKIYHRENIDQIVTVTQPDAEATTRKLSAQEGLCAGISSGGAVHAALRLSATLQNALIVVIICDRGDRYLSSGIFSGG